MATAMPRRIVVLPFICVRIVVLRVALTSNFGSGSCRAGFSSAVARDVANCSGSVPRLSTKCEMGFSIGFGGQDICTQFIPRSAASFFSWVTMPPAPIRHRRRVQRVPVGFYNGKNLSIENRMQVT